MLKLTIAAGSLGLMALAVPMQAHAQYGSQSGYPYTDPGVRNVQCERQKSDDSAAGTVVGALTGALIGGAIGNNIENDRTYTKYNRRGYPVRSYREGRSESGNVALGAVLGALVGGVAGNSIGKSSGPDCQVAYAPYTYSSSGQGSIPRTTDGLYGGPEVMGQDGYQSGYRATYPSSYPSQPPYPDYRSQPAYQEAVRDCRVIQRETRLPDGDVQRDPVTACYDERTREWRVQDGYTDEPYGY
ncbi:MAG: glycine zipper domain-containing protein [Hyphomonas sp.]|uniref:glycine zipper domain-containing protein n=1 Tax=Hyphomonas sp. TaxID=87 RepID=UPI0034A04CE4